MNPTLNNPSVLIKIEAAIAEQVRKNCTVLFAQVPDLQAKLITWATGL
ncbi:hypothetical protein ACKFKF_15895 [Phormidesmis sp. 146-12]